MAMSDIKAAFISRLISQSAVNTLTGGKIGSVQRGSYGAEPGYMILIRLAGSPGEEQWYEVGFQTTRLDCEFYGPTPDLATNLWRVAHPTICPQQGASGLHGFTAENCRVVSVEKEAGPIELIDPDTNLYFTFVSYVATWAEVSV